MSRRKTHEEFVSEVYELVGNEYEVLGKYTRTKDKILMRHEECEFEWGITPNNFLRGRRCPNCSGFKTTDEFKKDIARNYGEDITLLGDYIDTFTKVKLKCNRHNREFESSPIKVVKGTNVCRLCNAEYLSKVQRKPEEVFRQELEERHEGTIISLEPYTNTHTKIRLKCLECEKEFSAEPNSVIRISGCPNCQTSKGEKQIHRYLADKGIPFETQKNFEGCVYKGYLSFDFYLKDDNVLIEYDGKQHFEPIEFFGGEEEFREQKKRDSIKNKFAKDNSMRLIRIPYTVTGKDIDRELDSYLGVVTQESGMK